MITFGTLLWIDELNHSAVNNKNKSIISYFRQVALLSKTIRSVFGSELIVFTNNRKMIDGWFIKNGKNVPQIIQIAPTISVPEGIKFFGAHFKLDALIAGFKLIVSDKDRFFLLDTDVIANRKFDSEQLSRILTADLIVYDISDQVFPAYGADKICKDIELIAGEQFIDPKWFGGEFVGGSREGLKQLIDKSKQLLPRYFNHVESLHHVGDEMFVTSAINILLKEGCLKIINQVPFRLVSRHWSRHTDRSFRHHMQHSFVHCPGSKPALEFLSQFKNPSHNLIYNSLKLYQYAVLSYQRCKPYFCLKRK